MPAADQTDFIAIPDLEGVTLVRRTGRIPTRARHMHESLCVGAVLDGERVIAIDGESTLIKKGEAVVLLPGQVHACRDAGESRYLMVAIARKTLDQLGFDASTLAVASPCVPVAALYKAVLRLADLADIPASALEREAALLDVLGELDLQGDQPGSHRLSPNVASARAHIEACFTDDVRLETLAELANLSPCRLNRTFARQVGMPPHEYQNQLRVREVKRLIAVGTPLAEAAIAAGFSDQSHMTRCFRKVMGMTPGVFAGGVREIEYH